MIDNTRIARELPEGKALSLVDDAVLEMLRAAPILLVAIHKLGDNHYVIGALAITGPGVHSKPWVLGPYRHEGLEEQLVAAASFLMQSREGLEEQLVAAASLMQSREGLEDRLVSQSAA